VRSVKMDALSHELCGGTHVASTRDVCDCLQHVAFVSVLSVRIRYPFKITNESSISAGTRRIEAVAGYAAVQWYEQRASSISKLSRVLSCAPDAVCDRVESLLESGRMAAARTSQLEGIAAVALLDTRPKHTWTNAGSKLILLLAETGDADLLGNNALKASVETIRARENATIVMLLPNGVVMVACFAPSSANDLLACV
jgi:alanyl-tRNA synthetase